MASADKYMQRSPVDGTQQVAPMPGYGDQEAPLMVQKPDTSALKCAIVFLFVLNMITILALVVLVATLNSDNNTASSLKLGNGIVMAMPTGDGASGQVLSTNGAGQLAWVAN